MPHADKNTLCQLFWGSVRTWNDDFDLRATHARTLLPAALASLSFGFVLVRVRFRVRSSKDMGSGSWFGCVLYVISGKWACRDSSRLWILKLAELPKGGRQEMQWVYSVPMRT